MKCGGYDYDERTGEFRLPGAKRKTSRGGVSLTLSRFWGWLRERDWRSWRSRWRGLLIAAGGVALWTFRGYVYVALVWTWRFVWACLVWLALFAWECLCWLWPWIWAALVWCWNASLDRLASCWHWLIS